MRVTGTRLNLSPSSWGGLLDNTVSVAPFIRTVDVLRASFEEHRLRRSATGPPKTLSQERMDEGAHWIDDQPQSAAALRKRPPLLGGCSDQQSDFNSGNSLKSFDPYLVASIKDANRHRKMGARRSRSAKLLILLVERNSASLCIRD